VVDRAGLFSAISSFAVHQTHYEQMGDADGTVTVAGKQYPFHINSMRDHSYGHKREWKLLHRYGFHTMTLENGMRINVGIVSQPCTSSVLELGYVYSPDGQLFPVEKVDLNLWNIGEKGTPPTDYYFTFEAGSWQETIFFPPSEDDPFYPIDSQRDVGRSGERDRVTGIPHRLGMGGAYCGTHVHLRSERSARLGRFRVHVQSQEWPSD